MTRQVLADDARRFVASARVGRLATATPEGMPHVIPVCFELLGDSVYIGLDAKPKTADVLKLRRVRNIVSNPQASFIVDRYSDDWSRLGYVLVTADASLVDDCHERANAIDALRHKYDQYRTLLSDEAPVIRLRPRRVTSWGDMTPWKQLGDSDIVGLVQPGSGR